MRRVRILAALAAAMLVVGVLPATAQSEGETLPQDADDGMRFIGTASGAGFNVGLDEESLTVGMSEVGVQSSPDGEACDSDLACASAAGEATLGETAAVSISEGSASDDATAFDLNDFDPLVNGSIGTAMVAALVQDGVTSAEAKGGVLEADVVLNQELEDILGGELDQTLEELLGALEEGGDGGGDNPLDELIGELEASSLDLNPEEIEAVLADFDLSRGASTQSSDGGQRASSRDIANALLDRQAESRQADDPEDDDVERAAETLEQHDDGGGDPDAEELEGIIDDVLDGGGDDTEPDDLVGNLTGAIEDLLNDLTSRPLARIIVGPSASEAENASPVTAAASAQGAQVVVLPTDASTPENPEGLITLQVGSSSVSVTSDGANADANFDPALARLGLANPLTGEFDVVEVAPGESQCAGEQPLELCISVGDGDTTVEGSGASASANAVSITALGGELPQLSADLAAVTAAVNADDVVAPVEEPEPEPELPSTGGGMLLPGLLLLGAGGAGFAGLRRRIR